MKKIFFTALAVLALVSCSNDNEEVTPGGKAEKATLSIGIKTGEMSRAVGTAPSSDATVANFKAFVIDSDNSVKAKYSNSASDITDIEVSTLAKRVYVIANAGNLNLTTESAIKDYLADLNGTGAQTSTRWATGEIELSPSDFVETQGEFKAEVDVDLTFIAARITVNIKKTGLMDTYYDANAQDGSLVLQEVAILNARGQSKLFGTSLIPDAYDDGKKWYTGIDNDSYKYFPTTANYTYISTGLLSDNFDFTKSYYYYVFENDAQTAAKFPTIVVIKGTYDDKDIFFPVHLAPYEDWGLATPEFLTRGNSYDITITLTGDPRKDEGGAGGTDDPTIPVVSASVDVAVTINDWKTVTLGKEF